MTEPSASTSFDKPVHEVVMRALAERGSRNAVTDTFTALAVLADWLVSNPPRHQMRPRPEGLHHHSPYNDGYTDGWWAARKAVIAELRGQT